MLAARAINNTRVERSKKLVAAVYLNLGSKILLQSLINVFVNDLN